MVLLKRVVKRFSREFIFKNVNGMTDGQQRALLCYYVFPFLLPPQRQHTNELEVKGLAQALDRLGFIVDAIDYRYTRNINYKNYNLIIGLGNVFERSFYHECDTKRIFFATGCHPYFSSENEIRRVKAFQARTCMWISPTRLRGLPEYECATRLSDGIICLGNETTKNTYANINNNVKMQNAIASVSNAMESCKKKKNKFLWFGSAGLVHKGLDVVIEAFLKVDLSECELVIYCIHENSFFSYYNDALINSKNITYKGFRNIDDQELIRDFEESQWCILLSCSEGQSTSLLTAISHGCIPIASSYVGLQKSLKTIHCEIDIDELVKTIQRLLQMDSVNLINLMEMNRKAVYSENSYDAFVDSSEKNIYEIINDA